MPCTGSFRLPHREELFDLAYFKYKRHVEEKKESIYSTFFEGREGEESGPALEAVKPPAEPPDFYAVMIKKLIYFVSH